MVTNKNKKIRKACPRSPYNSAVFQMNVKTMVITH